MTKHAEKPSAQKQKAIDELVRKTIGPSRAIAKMIGRRYGSAKWSSYQQYLTTDGHTVFVNLDGDPVTAKLSDKPNAMHFSRYKHSQERAEKRLAKKAAKDAEAKESKAEPKEVKSTKKAKAAKA